MFDLSDVLQSPGSPFIVLVVRDGGRCVPAVTYGLQNGPIVFSWDLGRDWGDFRALVCSSLSLRARAFPEDVSGSELVDMLVGLYGWNAGVRTHGMVLVLEYAEEVGSLDLLALWLHKVGLHYAEAVVGDVRYERPALPYHVIIELSDRHAVRRVASMLDGLSVPYVNMGR
jgi:hypothetical protein